MEVLGLAAEVPQLRRGAVEDRADRGPLVGGRVDPAEDVLGDLAGVLPRLLGWDVGDSYRVGANSVAPAS